VSTYGRSFQRDETDPVRFAAGLTVDLNRI
jgi:hypothetical protein